MDPGLRDRWFEQTHRRIREAGLRTGAARASIVEFLAQDGPCLRCA